MGSSLAFTQPLDVGVLTKYSWELKIIQFLPIKKAFTNFSHAIKSHFLIFQELIKIIWENSMDKLAPSSFWSQSSRCPTTVPACRLFWRGLHFNIFNLYGIAMSRDITWGKCQHINWQNNKSTVPQEGKWGCVCVWGDGEWGRQV